MHASQTHAAVLRIGTGELHRVKLSGMQFLVVDVSVVEREVARAVELVVAIKQSELERARPPVDDKDTASAG